MEASNSNFEFEGSRINGPDQLSFVSTVDAAPSSGVDAFLEFLHSLKSYHEIKNVNYYKLLKPRLALQLYKYRPDELLDNSEIVKQEINALIAELDPVYEEFTQVINQSNDEPVPNLNEASLKVVDDSLAHFIHSHYHYLLSPREGIVHLGLFSANGNMLGLASYSRNDLRHLENILPDGIGFNDVLVLSRLVTFDNAPVNTSTFLLSCSKKWIRENLPSVHLIISYLDPNLGYTGSTYKAFNAFLLAEEAKKRYLFIDGKYASDREAIRLYGTADYSILKNLPGSKVSKSQIALKPLSLFAWLVDKKSSKYFQQFNSQVISPSKKLVG